jgi:hypothetical protein
MIKLNTKYILLLGIILTLFVAGSNTDHISLEQADLLRLTANEKTVELQRLTQLENTVEERLATLEQQDKLTQQEAIAIESLNNHAVSIRIMKQSVKNNRWRNWNTKKHQVSHLIDRTKKRL